MCGPLDSWRGAVVGIDRIVVVIEGGRKRGGVALPRGIDDEGVALRNKVKKSKVNFKV